jgi:putative membrane protein
MQSPSGPYQSPYGGQYGGPYAGGYAEPPRPHPRRWLFIGLAVMLAAIGVAVFLVILTPATFGYHPASGIGPFGLFGGFLLIFLFVWIILWIVRIGMWSSRSRGYNRPGGRGRRYGAFAIARERYARGEITREQYDQMMQDLQRPPGYPRSP